MRRWPLVVILVACGACGDSTPDDGGGDGTLIAIDEGAPPVTRQVVSDARTWQDVDWASVDAAGLLTIAPGCTVVPGTSGPPRLFSLPDADDGRTIVVQVSPSGSGKCLPRVLACVRAADASDCADADFKDQATGIHLDSLLPTGFCPGSQCGAPTGDEVLELKLFNPDLTNDPRVSARITTDAPLAYELGDNPGNFKNPIHGHLYDAEITGDFLVSSEVARDQDASQRLGIGTYHLLWEGGGGGFGIEGEYCTSPTSCKVHHDPTRSPDGNQCMSSDTQPIAIGVRVWVTGQAGAGGWMVVSGTVIGGTDPLIFHSLTDAGMGRIEIPLESDGPKPLFVEVPIGSFDKRVHLEVEGCSQPECGSLPDGGIPDVATDIALRRMPAECE